MRRLRVEGASREDPNVGTRRLRRKPMLRRPLRSIPRCTVLGLGAVLLSAAPAQDLYIANARILDVDAREVRSGNVLILDGMHTHSLGNFLPNGQFQNLGAERTARAALYAGVARYLDLFSAEDAIFAARAARVASDAPAADIFAAGPCLTATNGHCSEYGVPTRIVDSPADAKREIDSLAAKKPDVVKVVYDHAPQPGALPSIDRPTLEAVVAAAAAHGLKTVVHVGTWGDLRDSVRAGAAAVTHTPAGAIPDDIPRLMAERGTLHMPTLAVHARADRGRGDGRAVQDSTDGASRRIHRVAAQRDADERRVHQGARGRRSADGDGLRRR
jgi:hypothetical protein